MSKYIFVFLIALTVCGCAMKNEPEVVTKPTPSNPVHIKYL
jgi:hypothetical protein